MIQAIKKRQPHKIDIGAVFSASPKDHASIKPELFKPVERELVFDIDMTDYDDIRTCCTGANICHKCWPYMTMAVKVIDRALRDDFAFKHILWIYSGRRGVHCWVCDPSARALSNEARSAIVSYLSVEGNDTFDRTIHPMMRRAYAIMEPYFETHIADNAGQALLGSKASYMKVLNELPSDSIRQQLYTEWEKNGKLTGAERWQKMRAATTAPADGVAPTSSGKKQKSTNYIELEAWRYKLVFTHCYARLDVNVSKAQNHLLKSPFCVHPKTGRVCVPIDPEHADDFDPFTVPTVRSLCHEIDEYDRLNPKTGDEKEEDDVSDADKTSLKDALAVFNSSFMKGMWTTIRAGFREKDDQISAANVDF